MAARSPGELHRIQEDISEDTGWLEEIWEELYAHFDRYLASYAEFERLYPFPDDSIPTAP